MIPQLLVMMMQGAHEKDPPAFSEFFLCIPEIRYLYHHAEILHQEDPAEDRYQPFFANDDSECGYDAAQHQAARIAHKYLRRVSVVPEEPHAGPDQGADKDGQLAQVGDIHDV